MDEALDQEAAVLWPRREDAAPQVTRYHEELAAEADAGALCTVPLAQGGRFHGALTFERGADQPFRPSELQLIEAAISLSGPTLIALHRDDRWFGAKLQAAATRRLGELIGPRHVALKLVTAVVVLLVAFLALARGDFRVAADAVLEARVLRAAVAPFDGYVPEASVRAGDLVSEGQVLAALDDRELVLEQSRWRSELEQLRKQYRRALGDRDAPQVGIFGAQIEQATAQLALVESQLAKTQIRSPFDGVVVTGDLSQQLGSPVQRGQVLFEVAPLDEYRLVLEVDERDIDEIAVGQAGSLVFTAFPDDSFSFQVEKLTPVSEPSEGRNTFRVEARLEDAPPRLRPGMEGVGKVSADRRRLLWIWTHEATDWLRLALWKWLP
jgi:RND family efflux transporter MFP subunit